VDDPARRAECPFRLTPFVFWQMLARNTYEQEYIDACRARVGADLDAIGAGADARVYNDLVMLLDYFFVHRTRNLEGKDGNPINEVRVIGNSLLENNGVMAAEKQIKLDPAKSVLGYAPGDQIAVDEAGFRRLAAAFFDEIERRYTGS